jgi:positive regulator of sigma E activity
VTPGPGATLATLTTLTAAVTALLGLYVSYLAYRGYRRNDSTTMRVLAVGVLFIAVVPYAVSYAAAPLLSLTDAQTILGVTLSHTVGLAAIYRSLG